MKSKLNRDQS